MYHLVILAIPASASSGLDSLNAKASSSSSVPLLLPPPSLVVAAEVALASGLEATGSMSLAAASCLVRQRESSIKRILPIAWFFWHLLLYPVCSDQG